MDKEFEDKKINKNIVRKKENWRFKNCMLYL